MPPTHPKIILYTDGACSPNPGKGGWGVVLLCRAQELRKELSGGVRRTTNNRMELLAVIKGLKALKCPCEVRVHSDSKYVLGGYTNGWVANWKRNHWKTSAGQDVKNKDLWITLDVLVSLHKMKWVWVKGHSGDTLNDRADALAVAGRKAL